MNEEDTYELKKLVGMEDNLNRDGLIYEAGNKKKDKTYDFQKFKTIRSVGREIYCNLPPDDAFEKQISLKNDIDIFKESTKPEKSVKKEKKITLKNTIILLNGRHSILNAFECEIFPKGKQVKELRSILDKQLRILTPKEILQRLPIALAQVKAGNTYENLLNEIQQIIYSLYRQKEIT